MARRLGRFTLPSHAEELHQGIATWTNPRNKCGVLFVHYTAVADRRSLAWKASAREGYASEAAWNQEQEGDFSSWQGVPVYGAFSADLHVAREPLQWANRTDWPMIRGWDIGTHACVWAQLQRHRNGERLLFFTSRQTAGAFATTERKYERFEIDCSGLSVFIQECVALSERWFPDVVEWIDVCDPATFSRTITKQLPPSSIFQSLGLHPIPGRTQDIDTRVAAVEDWLSLISAGEPAVQVDPQAILLIDGLVGGYHWTQLDGVRKPDKGAFSHAMNAVEYLATCYPSPKSVEIRRQMARRDHLKNDERGRIPVRYTPTERERGRTSGKIDW